MFIRALQGHPGKNLDISTLSRKKIHKGYTSMLYHIGFSRSEDSITSGGLVPGGLGTRKGKRALYFSPVPPVDPCPGPEYKPYIHWKNHHARLIVIDLEASQMSLEFCQTAKGSVLCHDTVPSEFLTKIIILKDGSRRVGIEENKRRNRLTRKRVDATTDSRGKPPGIPQNEKQLNPDS